MRRVPPLIAMMLVGIAILLTLPGIVQAETTNLGPGSYHNQTHTLNKGDVLNWNWHVSGSGNVDFWIEDSDGTKHFSLYNATESDSWLTIPEDGDWMYVFRNDAPSGPSVTVEYDIDIVPVSEAEDLLSTLVWGFMLVGIIILILIITITWVLLRKERSKNPPQ